MNGVVVINKEKGFTSFDVVAVVRKTLGIKKVGHTGTLDPNATGVLPVLIGSATKAQDILPDHDKAYEARFRLGLKTDTLDIWGEELARDDTPVKRGQIEHILERFRGEIEQIPPMYSAVSVDGKRLYQYAREGKEVERRPRRVTVYTLELDGYDEKSRSGVLRIACSKGTYIRTLIDDIARSLGTVGVMTDLSRTRACGYTLEDALTLDELKARAQDGTLMLHSVESLFADFDELKVSEKQATRFVNGNPLDICRTTLRGETEDGVIYRVKNPEGDFLSLGITDVQKGVLKLYKHF